MCDETQKSRTDIPMGAGAQIGGQLQQGTEVGYENKMVEPTLRYQLENRRARLAAQLAEVDHALQVIYTRPESEEIFRILKRARI
jgi:hypothetical protein